MKRIEKEDVSVGSGIIATYSRMPQKLERVFAEFIDNSTQSFADHRQELIEANGNDVCIIKIEWSSTEIVISDNAYGMNREEFGRALKLNKPAEEYSEDSRSKYGMGLKIAAAYLGNQYSIDTTRLGGNERYYSVVDVEDWVKNNPNEIDNVITDSSENEHFTKITISKLQKKLTNAIDQKLRKKLADIYNKDLQQGNLVITLNGRRIEALDPELRTNSETGAEYMSYFSDSFEFDNRKYIYNGWIGILKTASTEDAGFTLVQSGRGITLNYRPSDIFGKSNSYQYQRVVGEIILDGEQWKVSFNKDQFIWDDGLEAKFIESLKSNREVYEMRTIAGKLRKDAPEPTITPKEVKKATKKLEERYKPLASVSRTQISEKINDEPIHSIALDPKEEENIVPITWEGINYTFDIRISNSDVNDDWFKLQKKSDKNDYYIVLNGVCGYFKDYKNKQSKDLIINFAIALALSQLSSVRLGLKTTSSDILLQQLNQIMKNIE